MLIPSELPTWPTTGSPKKQGTEEEWKDRGCIRSRGIAMWFVVHHHLRFTFLLSIRQTSAL
jgi:hypothetical protein